MKRTETLIVGGGQAGLAMSRCLTERGVDHVVLERGRLAERWRSERWDSLRLLTPSWQSRLPGWSYRGPDPDGFMTRDEVVDYLEDYARSFAPPVETGVAVQSVERDGDRFRVATSGGIWSASNVVVATGNCDRPLVPRFAGRIPREIVQVVPSAYRNPSELPRRGGVLVVGASATGVQLAEEIHRSGRPVTLVVGRHTRLPRRYRGRDIQWWLEAAGVWGETVADVHNVAAARLEPSLQLVGSPEHRTIDLGTLKDEGVRLVGRALDVEDGRLAVAGDLGDSIAAADARLARLFSRIDGFIDRAGLAGEVLPAAPLRAIVPREAPRSIDLRREGIATILWATGFRRSYPWLRVDVLDERGEIRHEGGVTPERGLFVLGLQFLRTRKSSFLDGVGADAEFLAERIAAGRRRFARRAA